MIEFIGSLLENISTFFTSVWNFIQTIFSYLGYVVQLLTSFLSSLGSYFDWLPGPVIALLLSCFGIVLIYKLLGREG